MLKLNENKYANWGYAPVSSVTNTNFGNQFPGFNLPFDTNTGIFTNPYALSSGQNTGGLGVNLGGLKQDNFWNSANKGVLGPNNPNNNNTGFGWNLGTAKIGVDAIAAIGGLYSALQSNKLAKKQFDFTKEITNTNLNNQIKTLNTSMEGRARARARLNGEADPEAYTRDYMEKNRLSRG